jgi:hypothetical protein
MATTLQTYIGQCQNFLHDPNANMFPIQELTGYINLARNRIAQDSKCLRQLATQVPLTGGVELYPVQATVALATPPMLNTVVDILGITLYWGTERVKMQYRSFTEFDASIRMWQTYQQRPVIFTRMGALQVYVGPVPDQSYVTDWDVAILPAPMTLPTDSEVIPPPFQDPVPFYACYLAKFKEGALGECKIFFNEYLTQGRIALRAFMTRIIPNPYA